MQDLLVIKYFHSVVFCGTFIQVKDLSAYSTPVPNFSRTNCMYCITAFEYGLTVASLP